MLRLSSLTSTLVAIAMVLSPTSPAQARELTGFEKGLLLGAGALAIIGIAKSTGDSRDKVYAPPAQPQKQQLPKQKRDGDFTFYNVNALDKKGYNCADVSGTRRSIYSWNGDQQVRHERCYVGDVRPRNIHVYFDGKFLRSYDGRWYSYRDDAWYTGTPHTARDRDRDRDDHRPWGHDDRRADRDRDRDRTPEVGTVWMDGPYSCGTNGYYYDRDADKWQRGYPSGGYCRLD